MKFMMFVATDAQPDDKREGPGDIEHWLETAGTRRLDGDRLKPQQSAKTVRVRSGNVLITDGPFAETKESIVGFDILECASLEEAVEIAAAHPMARAGRIELREFWPPD